MFLQINFFPVLLIRFRTWKKSFIEIQSEVRNQIQNFEIKYRFPSYKLISEIKRLLLLTDILELPTCILAIRAKERIKNSLPCIIPAVKISTVSIFLALASAIASLAILVKAS